MTPAVARTVTCGPLLAADTAIVRQDVEHRLPPRQDPGHLQVGGKPESSGGFRASRPERDDPAGSTAARPAAANLKCRLFIATSVGVRVRRWPGCIAVPWQ